MQSSVLKPVMLAALLGASGATHAAITSYDSPASFLAAVGATGVDTFAGFSITGATPSPINRAAGAFNYTGTATDGFFGAGTTGDPWLSTNTASDTITLTPTSAGVAGIGGNFFGSNLSGLFALGELTITAVDSFGSSATSTVNATSPTGGSFLGFVSTGTIASLTITATQPAGAFLWPTVDNLTLAAPIPEPGTYALMLGGLGLVGFLARRRRAD
jgi:hypothetical protein